MNNMTGGEPLKGAEQAKGGNPLQTEQHDVIIALDFPGREASMAFLARLGAERPYVKVGMELFYGTGPDFIQELKDRGHRVFLDLKLHDIPNTVQRTMKVLAGLGADMCNVHAAGTAKMMVAAREGLEQGVPAGMPRPLLIAVTQLTSTDQWRMNKEILIPGTVEDAVGKYAALAQQSGLDGVVCSPEEAPAIHTLCGSGFLTVTPGIRLLGQDGAGKQDQVRVQTPKTAKALGSDFIVVGRPVTEALDPLDAYLEIKGDFLD
jgi:orotidine-5'-phosphate decarboxylase